MENAEVARLFREVADLLEIQDANPFRVRAYRTAARTVEELPEPIDALAQQGIERLDALPGIGEDLAGKIQEIVRSGTLTLLTELERTVPRGTPELMHVPGLGPKRARVLVEHLKIRSLDELQRAAEAGRIHTLPGFGAKTEQKILHELEARRTDERRIGRSVAAQYGESLLGYLRALPGVQQAEIAGSYRRCRDTVGDLDVLVSGGRGAEVIERFLAYPEVAEVLARGPTKASVRLRSGLQVDLRVLKEASFGAGLHYFTGSKAHNIAVRRRGQQRGLKINEYGVYRGGKRIAGRTEEEVFAAVELPWIPPELREDRGELEAAREHRLPQLVELTDIRGDLQLHTRDSDGRNTLEEMAEAAEARGYEYMAVTDHSAAVRIARGMDAAGFRRQMKRIERLNRRLQKLTVLKGAEVDIRANGSLDLPDALLEKLDLVLIAAHSKLELPAREQTRRLVKALQHPSVDVLGHPTGRLLGRRRGMSFDLDEVIRAAADHGVLLEVDAQPDRLDLDELGCCAAIEHGVRLVISTDAHAVAELRFMRWGVEQARRGWAEKDDIANTRPLGELLKLLHRGRR
jgi:DNA polymerase (family X)